MNERDFAELSAGRALGALSPQDERAYQDALADRPEWAAIAAADEATVAAFAASVPEQAPPLAARSQLLRQIRPTPADTAAATGALTTPDTVATPAPDDTADTAPRDRSRRDVRRPDADEDAATPADETVAIERPSTDVVQTVERRAWMRVLFGLVASMVLLVGIGWVAGSIVQRAQTPAAVTALDEIEAADDARSVGIELDDGGSAVAHWSPSVGKTVLVSNGLPDIPADRTFELWFVRGDEPIAAGTFDADDGSTTALLEGEMVPGDTIAVTVEPDGGSPGGVPTGDPIIVIPTR